MVSRPIQDGGDARHAEHIALLRLTAFDQRERGRQHADLATRARDPVRFGLAGHVDHVRLTRRIEMRQW